MKNLLYCGIHNLVNFENVWRYYDICYGFDANPDKVAYAREVYKDNPRIKIIHGALCERSGGEIEFNITTDWDPSSSIGKPNPDYLHMRSGMLVEQKVIKVPTLNLFDFLVENSIYEVDTLITDLQGMDLTVLKTLKKFIDERRIREIQCEVEPDDTPPIYLGLNSNKIKDFKSLLSHNYEILWIHPEMPPPDAWEQDARWRAKGSRTDNIIEFIIQEPGFIVPKSKDDIKPQLNVSSQETEKSQLAKMSADSIQEIKIFLRNQPQEQTADSPKNMNEKAEKLIFEGRASEARELLTVLISRWPDNAIAHNSIAGLYWKEKDFEKAFYHYTSAIKLDPFEKKIVLDVSDIMMTVGKNADAETLCLMYLTKKGEDKEISALLEKIQKSRKN